MLTLLPALLLLLSSVAVLVLRRVKSGFGIGWLVSALTILLVWGLVLSYRWLIPAPFVLDDWLKLNGPGLPLRFVWNPVSWTFAFAVISLLFGVLWTTPARFESQSSPATWSANLALGGVTLLAVIASSPAAVLIFWGVIDFVELGFMALAQNSARQSGEIVTAFFFRFLGLLLAVAAFAIGSLDTPNLTLETLSPRAGMWLLGAVGLRLGVLPLHLPYREEGTARRGLGLTMRMAGPAAALLMLPYLPAGTIPSGIQGLTLALLSLAALYGSSRWVLAKNEIEGRPFWLIAAAAAAVIAAVKGAVTASLGWSLILLIGASPLFLFSHREPLYRVFLLPAWIAMSGLPLTPAGSTWSFSLAAGFEFADLVTAVAHTFLLVGFIRHSLSEGLPPVSFEPWMRFTYLTGIALVGVTLWVDGLASGLITGFSPFWWAGTAVAVLAAGLSLAIFPRRAQTAERKEAPLGGSIQTAAGLFNQIFSLSWVYAILWGLYSILSRIVRAFTAVLEGEGGVLWAVLLLALLVSLLSGGGT